MCSTYSFKKLIIPILFLASCGNNPENISVPKGIISPAKMKELMPDILVANAYKYGVADDTLKKREIREFYHKALSRHGVSMQEFSNSLTFYNNHPEAFSSIYAAVIDSLDNKWTKSIENKSIQDKK